MRKDLAFWISLSLTVLVAGFIVSYAFFRSKDLLGGPIITISYPLEGAVLKDSLIEVTGNIKNAVAVSMNDRKIFLDEQGDFKEKLLLSKGYTIITLKAEDRYKRAAEKKLELIVTE